MDFIDLEYQREEMDRQKAKRILRPYSHCSQCGKRLKYNSHDNLHKKCYEDFVDNDGELFYDTDTGNRII